MARKAKQELAVDGTAKLAAKGKAGDKHDKANLNIEEATVASPRESRKRHGYFNDFEEGEGDEAVDTSTKATNAKTSQLKKKAKTSPSDDTPKPAKQSKKPKAKDTTSDAIDETVGDRVKADAEKPTKAKKEKKGKGVDKDVVVGPSGDTAEVNGAISEEKPAKKAKAPKSAETVAKPKKESKSQKEKANANKDIEKPTKTKKADKKAADEVATDAEPSSKEADKPAKAKKASKKTVGAAATEAKPSSKEVGSKDEAPTTKPKAKRSKKDTKPAPPEADAEDGTDTAMDQGPFEKLLDTAKDKEVKETKVPKTKKAAEKAKKDPKAKDEKKEKKSVSAKQKDASKKVQSPAETETTKPKPRKRKASAAVDPETVKADILDPLADHASAPTSKKQKKDSRKSIGEAVGGIVNSGLEAAAQGANSLKESFGGLTGETKASLTDNTPEALLNPGEAAVAAQATAKGKGKEVVEAVKAVVGASTNNNKTNDDEDDEDGEDEESDIDDQTAALIKSFESDDEPAEEVGEGYEEGNPIPAFPDTKATQKKLKALKKNSANAELGVIYVGRIPHGFYEQEMRAYFSQFGNISKLRLSRSRQSGKSKGYAFIEFENLEVAKIAAGTMNNYLLFGHLLKCKTVPKEDQHESLWKGANKHFKSVPWNKIEGRKLEMPLGKSAWNQKIEKTEKQRKVKAEKAMEVMGYEFEAPKLKSPDEVKKGLEGAVEELVEQEKSVVTAAEDKEGGSTTVVSETVRTKVKKSKADKPKKENKDKKEKDVVETVAAGAKRALEDAEEGAEKAVKKVKKAKKASKATDDA